MSESSYTKDFMKKIHTHRYGVDIFTLFCDFVELAARSISTLVSPSASPFNTEAILSRYTPEIRKGFPALWQITVDAYRDNADQDFLGPIYMEVSSSKGEKKAGQYFTPYFLSVLAAKLSFNIAAKKRELADYGYVTVFETAVGAGGMLIALAKIAEDNGIPRTALRARGEDIDPCCVYMAYIQCSLAMIPAVIAFDNALSMEISESFCTPACYLSQAKDIPSVIDSLYKAMV